MSDEYSVRKDTQRIGKNINGYIDRIGSYIKF